MASKDDIIARVFDISSGRRTYANVPIRYVDGGFVVTSTSSSANLVEVDVPGVILRAETHYRTFEVLRMDAAIWVGDIVKTAPDTSAALELLVGARVGIKRGSAIKMLTESTAAALHGDEWEQIILNRGGMWAKFHKQEKPLTIQTHGGVLGIKG